MAGTGYRHLEIVQDFEKYVRDKKVSARAYYRYFLARLQRMFQYKNLPDTIPHEILDRYLFEFGIACITKVEDKLYVFSGNLGGPQDVYYRPTEFIISNPHIKINGELFTANVPVFEEYTSDNKPSDSVGQPTTGVRQEGVLMRNDSDWIGLHPLISRYAYLMAENALTLRTADVMLRIIALITAPTDSERASAMEYLKSIEKGELGVIGESDFTEKDVSLQSPPSNNGSYLTQFIEYQQYLKGSFYNEIGLSANYNMKREAIGKGESTLDEDALLPLCDNMLRTRKEDIAKVNKMFNTEIEVEFSSSWLENRIEALSTLRTMSSTSSTSTTSSFSSVGQPTNLGNDSSTFSQSEDGGVASTGGEVGSSRVENGATYEQDSNLEVNGSNGETSETNEDPTIDETENKNSESEINDLSQDEELTELLDKAKEDEPVGQPTEMQEGVEDSDTTESKEGSEDKADNSED